MIRVRFLSLVLVTAGALVSIPSHAQTTSSNSSLGTDPRGPAELTICSQNLQNYGRLADARARARGLDEDDFKRKELALVRRFISKRCDVIAVQELLGRDEVISKAALEGIAKVLRARTNRIFEARVGPTNDLYSRLGFLVAKDRAEILNVVSYARTELPKLSEKERPRLFSRGPLEIQLLVKGKSGSPDKTVTLVTFHFKSRAGGSSDPAGLEFETYRMAMSEALRRIVESRHGRAFAQGDTILALLGDRNSNFDLASARILEGVFTLTQFKAGGACRLSKRGMPLCQAETSMPQRLFSVLTLDPQTKLNPGTHRYNKVYSWLDDIMMPAESLPFARSEQNTEGDYDSGVVYTPVEASDHAMVYVRLNW